MQGRRHYASTPRPHGHFRTRVARRHVDLLRVCSALCPGKSAVR